MLRFRVMASAVPLLLIGLFARGELNPGPQPCIATADGSIQLAPLAWQAQIHVGFTEDPARANVRVRIVDDPAMADFAVVDDVDDGWAPTRRPAS